MHYYHLNSYVHTFLQGAPVNDPDFDKELWVHAKLLNHITFQSGTKNPDDVFVRKQGNCTGYSRAIAGLLGNLGVKFCIISEQGSGGEHMCNIVWISGHPCLLNDTYDKKDLQNTCTHEYFNLSKNKMSANHTPNVDEEELWNQCIYDDFDYYRNKGCYFTDVSQAEAYLDTRRNANENYAYSYNELELSSEQ